MFLELFYDIIMNTFYSSKILKNKKYTKRKMLKDIQKVHNERFNYLYILYWIIHVVDY